MATITDSLVTLLQMRGGPQYAQQMQQAANATEQLSSAQQGAAKAVTAFAGAFGLALGSAGLIAGGVSLLKQTIDAFRQQETEIFRATVIFRNLGNSYPVEKAQAFASALQQTTAADDEALVGVQALLKSYGVADSQIQSTTKTVLDASEALGVDLTSAATAVARGMQGQTRALRLLRVQMQDTGNTARNLAVIQQKLNDLYGHAAAARINTLDGALTRLGQSWHNILETAGNISGVVNGINALATAFNNLSKSQAGSGGLAGALIGGGIGAGAGGLFGGPAGILPGLLGGALLGGGVGGLLGHFSKTRNAAEQIGTGKGRLATEDTLREIANNTAQLNPLIRQVIGGTGEVARRSFSYRDARMAFGV